MRSHRPDLVRTIIHDKYSGSMNIITHLDQISHCATAFGTNSSSRWTYRGIRRVDGPIEYLSYIVAAMRSVVPGFQAPRAFMSNAFSWRELHPYLQYLASLPSGIQQMTPVPYGWEVTITRSVDLRPSKWTRNSVLSRRDACTEVPRS